MSSKTKGERGGGGMFTYATTAVKPSPLRNIMYLSFFCAFLFVFNKLREPEKWTKIKMYCQKKMFKKRVQRGIGPRDHIFCSLL